ncbi:MAG: penicillin-binding transpeptidase domain-containing protein [Acidimicrobiia bacterium]
MGFTFATRRWHRFWRPRTLVVVVVVVALAGGALFELRRGHASSSLPTSEVDGFLSAWTAGDAPAMAAFIETPPSDLATTSTSLVQSAPGSTARYLPTGLFRSKTGATATYRADVNLAGFGSFTWNSTLTFVRVKQPTRTVWQIQWQPGDLFPGLESGQHLMLRQSPWPTRAPIVADNGALLAGSQSVVEIGLEPGLIAKSLATIKQRMKSLVGTDAATIDAALRGPGVEPNYFVEIATVPDDARYHSVLRPQLAPIPGVFFHASQAVLAPRDALLTQLVGTVGPITAEGLHQLGPPYRQGDLVGQNGLQSVFETRLAGRPAAAVVIESSAGTSTDKVIRTMKRFPGRDPKPVDVTIDPGIQQAADAALAGETLPAALVAIDVPTGQIRAIVSKPDNEFDRAVDGKYPPGSTFKIITATALLAAGRTGSTPAPCPVTLTVDGETFRNFEGEASGNIDLAQAFKISCNNAFIGLADQLPPGALGVAAASYGFNRHWSLPVPTFDGSYPTPTDRADRAASAIGQAAIVASPLQMASVAAAVASGQWRAPVLTTNPTPTTTTAPPLNPAILTTLRGFMAGVEQAGGTAANAGLPSGVFGKTGTAEYGSANPPQTHAWFIGYRGNLAFAVIVEGGGVGGTVAAPLAANFLGAL